MEDGLLCFLLLQDVRELLDLLPSEDVDGRILLLELQIEVQLAENGCRQWHLLVVWHADQLLFELVQSLMSASLPISQVFASFFLLSMPQR